MLDVANVLKKFVHFSITIDVISFDHEVISEFSKFPVGTLLVAEIELAKIPTLPGLWGPFPRFG